MSSTNLIEVATIKSLRPHPNADRLDVAIIHGYETVVPKGMYTVGETVVFFPPDMLIDPAKAEQLGVAQYLKHAEYDGVKCKSRIAACRLRGQVSYGFVSKLDKCDFQRVVSVGEDVTEHFGGCKYQPPEKFIPGDQEPEHGLFHRYTDIENYARYPDLIPEGTEVRITEKLHGTNARLGVIKTGEDAFEYMCGSHNVRRKSGLYWEPLDARMMAMLNAICNEQYSVIVFGEIFGPGVQDMHYGQKEKSFRVFDISVDGQYQDWSVVEFWCARFGIKTVPLLYQGPFYPPQLELAYGPSCVGGPLREGIVITPLREQVTLHGKRMILKYISADYLNRA